LLNVHSTPRDDPSTRARIRDAAIVLFSTKDGLRAACDEQVLLEFLRRRRPRARLGTGDSATAQ